MTNVLMVASEAAPFAKTGGLADVVGTLPAALAPEGVEAAVVLPRYRNARVPGARRVYDRMPLQVGPHSFEARIYLVESGARFYFVDCPELFDREGFYSGPNGDYPDNHVRFAALAKAALGIARHLFRPHLFHCHDWQSGLLPVYLKTAFAFDPSFLGVRTLFSIHNLGYQGLAPGLALPETGLGWDVFRPDLLEFHGNVSMIKGGLVFADHLSTVSPRYAQEIQTQDFGFGLDGMLRARSHELTGILNGCDYSDWNPETDRYLPANYSAADLSGKQACKRELLQRAGLPEEAMERPVFGIVSRLTYQKGHDLTAAVAGSLVEAGGYLVTLGDGEPGYVDAFRHMAWQHPGRISVTIDYSEPYAHLIEAGADSFLMPSRYEPCGLNQMYSLRYGTPPVVRATGGLDDTISEETGFKFYDFSHGGYVPAIQGACAAYADRDGWRRRMIAGMNQDYSWRVSAARYAELYRRILSQNGV